MTLHDFDLVGGELWLLAFACIALLVDVFSGKAQNRLTLLVVLIGLSGAVLINLHLGEAFFAANVTKIVPQIIMHGMFIVDPLAILAKCVTCLLVGGVFLYAREYINQRDMPQGEFYVLGLFALIGMHTMISANHFLSLYMGLELLSLPLYAMVAMRRDRPVTSEAAIKYFVMGALASGILLYGISLVYGATGALDFPSVQQAIANSQTNTLLLFALVFIITGMAFKLGAVPFHMWIPDVYQGAPAAVTLFVATAPKVAAVVMVLRVLLTALPDLMVDWLPLMIMLSVGSMALGNFVAIMQVSLKRLLAFSSIAQIGYVLLGLISGNEAGFSASLFYIIIYAVMTLGTFGLITMLSQRGEEFEWIDDLKGLNTRNPWLAFMLLIMMFSLAGIPPTVGFFAKLSVLQALVKADMIWLAIVALVFAVFGAFYYIRVIRTMYFEEPIHDTPLPMPVDTLTLVSLNGVMLILLGLAPGGLLQLCQLALSAMP